MGSVLLASLAAVGGLWYSNLQTRQANEQARQERLLIKEGQITDRYTAAVENLGDANRDVRLGGIYALQRIMQDSHRDQPTIANVLATYVRSHASKRPPMGEDVPADVDAALTVLATRESDYDAAFMLDLTGVQLPRFSLVLTPRTYFSKPGDRETGEPASAAFNDANLCGAVLTSADLTDADLSGSHLCETNLGGALLTGADLRGAVLDATTLRSADLVEADLGLATMRGADLRHARLDGARLDDTTMTNVDLRHAHLDDVNLRYSSMTDVDLRDADLDGLDLTGATLQDIDFRGADLTQVKLTANQLDGARIDADTKLPPHLS
ncbi:pentapeptide repeat-containing protein [Streptomyces sp. WAC 06738]|uniref:pentapeptide repeat-containing protein n=1 Tax=Streptomyces sp. WAC 06738 TaxID=2203210 RepID=UPI0013DEEC09|nr:pentapeptide repeat-containing protein [Streptomyces sp. WAC 06738]